MSATNHISVLSPEEVKAVLRILTNREQNVVARLLIEGLSVKEITNIRVRDLKPMTNQIVCHRPRRRVNVSRISMLILIEIVNRTGEHSKSTKKVISFKERNIRHFIGEAGSLTGIGNISPKTLQNTFIPWTLLVTPKTPVGAIHNQLGYSDIEYTKRVMRESILAYAARFGVTLKTAEENETSTDTTPASTHHS